MLKLIFWVVVLAVGYLMWRGRQELAAKKEHAAEVERRTSEHSVIDVEAEDITQDSTGDEAHQRI